MSRTSPRRPSIARTLALKLIAPSALFALWWAASASGAFPPLLLPGPEAVAKRAWTLLSTGELERHAAVSIARVFAGFALSSVLALFAAFALYRSKTLEEAASPILESLRVIPPLSLVPLLILWLGIDEAPKLAIVILASFFPVHLSALSALKATHGRYLELSAVLGLSRAEADRHILIPGAAPGILTGLRLGFGYAWRALVGAELIAAGSGLGYLIEDASLLAKTDVVIVGILAIAILGTAFDAVFQRLAAKLMPGRRERRAQQEKLTQQMKQTAAVAEGEGAPRPLFGIRTEGLALAYANGRRPVDGLSAVFPAGEVTALLGRSGCGKTTLLKAFAGLLKPSAGRFAFAAEKTEETAEAKPVVGLVFQEPTLLPWKTAKENVMLALLHEPQAEAERRAMEALSLAGLADRADDYPESLSGGQQQRVGFARALARKPDILLMDEPFGALDALTRAELQAESIRIFERARMTVVMVTHDVREAVRMADRLAVLSAGKLIFEEAVDAPKPRRIGDPVCTALEERVLGILMALPK